MLCYCDKCGNICDAFKDELEDGCYCCDNLSLKPIPNEYIDNFRWRDGDGKQAFIDEVIKTSPNLDQYLFEHKDEIIQAKNDDMNAKMTIGRAYREEQSRVPKCPTCQSTNLSKITITKKAVKTGLFGIFGAIDDAGKTWKCNGCGSKF